MSHKPVIAVIGPNTRSCTPEIYAFGEALGEALVTAGFAVVCGGMGGLMEAVCKGAKSAPTTFFGATLGILPGTDRAAANAWCDLAVPTGMGIARNALVVRSGDAVVAVGGGSGTLSEIALAWQLEKPILCVEGLGGWSEKMAGKQVDARQDRTISRVISVSEIIRELKDLFQRA